MNRKTKILIIMAMQGEAKPILNILNMFHKGFVTPGYPAHYYESNSDIILAVNGEDPRYCVDRVATQPSAVTAFSCIEKFKPDMLFNFGTVGALNSKGAEIFDIYLANKISFLDRRIPIHAYQEYGFGHYQSSGNIELAKDLNVKFSNLVTSNSLGFTDTDWQTMEKLNASINDMEAASIADIALLKGIPFYSLKVVTNLLDKPIHSDGEDFENNFDEASLKLSQFAVNLISIFTNLTRPV